MSTFTYRALDAQGKSVQGTMEGESVDSVAKMLRVRGYTILQIDETKGLKIKKRKRGRRIRLDDVVIFSRQMSTMVDAGLPILQSLEIQEEQMENPVFKNIVTEIRTAVEGGKSLSESMTAYEKTFGALYVNMVKAGEASGMLDEILDRVATYLEKMSSLQKKVRSAMIYPSSVTLIAIVITLFLVIKVIPTFRGIFDSLGAELPVPTKVLLGISDYLNNYFLWFVAGVAFFVFLIWRYKKTEKGAYNLDALSLKMPIFGKIFRKVAVSKFTRTFATLIKSGVNILDALEIVAFTAGNKPVEKVVLDTRQSIKEGESIAVPLAKGDIFPPMVIRMISVGEQTGAMEEMLNKISDFYDDEVDNAISSLTALIEPLLIAFLGVVIGGIVVAMFIPIFQMSSLV